MGSWFACNVNQHGNLRLFCPWSVLFALPGKPLLVLPRPALLPSRCSSRLTAFIAIIIWIFLHELGAPSLRKMPFLDPKIFQRSRQRGIPTPEQKGGNWESPPWAGSSHHLRLSSPLTLHSPHCLAVVTLLGDYRLLENKDYVFHL